MTRIIAIDIPQLMAQTYSIGIPQSMTQLLAYIAHAGFCPGAALALFSNDSINPR
jgi:hypothetical protein